mmetsp:Transcript_36395/g.90757  ORF Transcript_36395/g.90757 Transcript_36395/m.90757 type:complete len:217 (+) Transcript_36395:246-896(+)
MQSLCHNTYRTHGSQFHGYFAATFVFFFLTTPPFTRFTCFATPLVDGRFSATPLAVDFFMLFSASLFFFCAAAAAFARMLSRCSRDFRENRRSLVASLRSSVLTPNSLVSRKCLRSVATSPVVSSIVFAPPPSTPPRLPPLSNERPLMVPPANERPPRSTLNRLASTRTHAESSGPRSRTRFSPPRDVVRSSTEFRAFFPGLGGGIAGRKLPRVVL